MEDSRNIIKAIDALTLKAGGEVVDSKNITEAIDNFRSAFTDKVITEEEVEEVVTDFLTEHPISPSTVTNAVNTYLQNNPASIQDTAVRSDLQNLLNLKTDAKQRTTWSKKRVNDQGQLINSPSQITSDNILYVGKGNILKVTASTNERSINVNYFINDSENFTFTGVYDTKPIRKVRYIKMRYDYVRISFVGTSDNPPLVSEFDISLIESSNDEFVNKNVSFLGDSITAFRGVSEGIADGARQAYYPSNDVEFFEHTYEKMFFDASGASNISISAVSSSSWRSQNAADLPPAYDDTRIARLALNGTPDYIIINMGTNDPYSSNIGESVEYTFDIDSLSSLTAYTVNAMQLAIRKIQSTYPNARIILLIPKFPSTIGTEPYTFDKWEKVCNFISIVGNMYGVYKIVDLRKCGITVDTLPIDCISGGMHPNFNGMKKMGTYLIKELLL